MSSPSGNIRRGSTSGRPRPGAGRRWTQAAADPAGIQGRLAMEVLTRSGRAAGVEFRIRADTVEVWHDKRLSAALDRPLLRDWLADPGAPLNVGEVAFSLDRMVDCDGRVALTLPDVLAWTLTPSALNRLRHLV